MTVNNELACGKKWLNPVLGTNLTLDCRKQKTVINLRPPVSGPKFTPRTSQI
jgi:hypothetical protein